MTSRGRAGSLAALFTSMSGAFTAAHAVERRSLLKRVERDQGIRLDTDADLTALAASGRMPPELRAYLDRYGSRLRIGCEGDRLLLRLREEVWPYHEFSFGRSAVTSR